MQSAFNCKFNMESSNEKVFLIGEPFTELWSTVCGPAFLAHPVYQKAGSQTRQRVCICIVSNAGPYLLYLADWFIYAWALKL